MTNVYTCDEMDEFIREFHTHREWVKLKIIEFSKQLHSVVDNFENRMNEMQSIMKERQTVYKTR
jgi:hypothetical protein